MITHTYACPLRWSDTDLYGMVNNVSYVRLLEEARVDLIWHGGSPGKNANDAFFQGGSVVVRQAIEYKKAITNIHRHIDIEMWISDLRHSTLTMEYIIKDSENIYALATSTLAPYNNEIKFPRSISSEEMEFFGRFLHSDTSISRQKGV